MRVIRGLNKVEKMKQKGKKIKKKDQKPRLIIIEGWKENFLLGGENGAK